MAVATVNKKGGLHHRPDQQPARITRAGSEHRFADNIYLTVPDTQGERGPIPPTRVSTEFSVIGFFHGGLPTQACKSLCRGSKFWLPLISCLHGMSSSEILQLGPDTVGPNPDDTGYPVF